MKRFSLILALVLCSCLAYGASTASQIQDLYSKYNALKTQANSLQTQLDSLTSRVSAIEQKQTATDQYLQEQILKITEALQAINAEIQSIKSQLPTTPPPPPPPPTSDCTDCVKLQGGEFTQPVILNTASAHYLLTANATFDATAFSVQASNITLECAPNVVITYGAKTPYSDVVDPANRVFGVLGSASYVQTLPIGNNPSGGTFSGFTLKNCGVRQAGGGPYSDALRLGQGGGNNLTAIGNTFEVSGNSARAIFSTYACGSVIANNKIYSKSTAIINRHQLDGAVIKRGETANCTTPDDIHDNEIYGSPQGGIMTAAAGSKIYKNKIRLNSSYTNDFGVYAWGKNQTVNDNDIDNTQGTDAGRGIQVNSSNVTVFNNTLKVRELPRNIEYNGCEAGGAYGIQLEKASMSANVYANNILAIAGPCDAAGFRLSGGSAGSTNVITNNVIKSLRESSTSAGIAIGITTRGCNDCLVKDNDITADTYFYHDVTQDSGEPETIATLSGNINTKGPNPSTAFKVWYLNNYANAATYKASGLTFNNANPLDIKAFAIGQPTSLAHKPYNIYLDGRTHIYNNTVQPVIVEQVQ